MQAALNRLVRESLGETYFSSRLSMAEMIMIMSYLISSSMIDVRVVRNYDRKKLWRRFFCPFEAVAARKYLRTYYYYY